MRKLILLLALLLFSGCMAAIQPGDPVTFYEEYFLDWQERIERDGWSENLVDDVVKGCRYVMKYKWDEGEHWATPREMKEWGMRGDCEDFAVLMMASLKRLDYPYQTRIQAIRTPMTDHAMFRVELPDGRWKRYDTASMPGSFIDLAFSWVLFEFDETQIYRKN